MRPIEKSPVVYQSTTLILACTLGLLLPPAVGPATAGERPEQTAREILAVTGVSGGLVVHAGCGDGKLTAALRTSDAFLVQGLDADPRKVSAAREYIRSRGLYGPVSVQQWSGNRLPYTDNIVNLLVSDGSTDLPADEVARVLAPGGVVCSREGDRWDREINPRPDDIDEWTHYLHGADNNAVAQDDQVGPPGHLQWKSGPMWCRSHEYNSSIGALVSASDRVFCIVDNGVIGLHDPRFQSRWSLIARNAFNGVKLWERPLREWGPGVWKNVGFRSNPLVMPRRLVAVGDTVYATLSYNAPLSILDAATGKTQRVCKGTENTDEIIYADGTVLLRVRKMPEGDPKRQEWQAARETVVALNPKTGKILWRRKARKMLPLSLASGDGKVCYHNYQQIVCLDLKTGDELWRAPSKARSRYRSPAKGRFHVGGSGTLLIYKGAVVFTAARSLESFDLSTGKKLWAGPRNRALAPSQPSGLFGAQGLLWPVGSSIRGTAVHARGYEPTTGKVEKEIKVSHLISPGHHVRCYRSKATERYLLLPKRGVEFVDLEGADHMRHDWLRAPCSYGAMPANGLLYMPSSQCFCYPGVKLSGFNAIARLGSRRPQTKPEDRLVQGPAWGTKPSDDEAASEDVDWPTYRHDILRSGSIDATLPVKLKRLWKKDLGEAISPPVAARGRIYTADKNAHMLRCLDAASGRELWSFTADGRIDSSPTVYRGLVLFGSTDGHAYCLRASDGKMVWRFRAAPSYRRIVVFGQLESAWPVHGNVLVQDGVAYFTAGRSSFLDGGIYVYGVEPATGEVLHRTRLQSNRPDVSKDAGRPFDMDGARSNILVSDGEDLYMFQVRLNADLSRQDTPRASNLGNRKMGLHLVTTKSFLNDTMFNRTYWAYWKMWPGFYFAQFAPKAGQILSFDDTTTYGVHVFRRRENWSPVFRPGEMDYELFADANSNDPILLDEPLNKHFTKEQLRGLPGGRRRRAVNVEKGVGFTRTKPPKWSVGLRIRVKAMLLAGDNLYVAGTPGDVPEDDPLASFEGRNGTRLRVSSTADGKKLAEYKMQELPAFDGMIAAGGRIYIATQDGSLICMGE